MKKFLSFILIFTLCLLLCACGDDTTQTDSLSAETQKETQTSATTSKAPEKSPEEVTKEFVRAMYCGDLDGFFALIPEFTYDVLITAENLEVADGASKGDVVYNYFKSNMEQEPEEIATEVAIETKISDTLNKDTYYSAVNDYYIPEGFISEQDLEKIEDVVFVAFNCDVKFKNGETFSLTDFKSALPCIKVDGKWYAEYLYLMMVPIHEVTVEKKEPIS